MRNDAAARFWSSLLSDAPDAMRLPETACKRGAVGQALRASVLSDWTDTVENVRQFAERHGLPLPALLLSAWSILLARYSGQKDLLLGLRFPGTPACASGVLPFRIDLSADPSFAQLAEKVAQLLEQTQRIGVDLAADELARLWQTLPFEHSTISQHVFVIRTTELAAARSGSSTSATVAEARPALQLEIVDTPAERKAQLVYDNTRHSTAAAERMARHLGHLLRAATQTPGTAVSAIPILCDTERRHLLRKWNNTVQDYPHDRFLHELFERQVELTPQAPALECAEARYTYQELNATANRLARHLLAQGVSANALVGVCMERSAELVIALLAILKTGAAYVPLDPAYPQARIAYMVGNAKITTVLTQARLQQRLPEFPGRVVLLDRLSDLTAEYSGDNLAAPSPRSTTACAYVIYTSGSTGTPKGIRVAHRNVVNFVSGMADTPGLGAEDTFAAVTTISFDIHVLELYLPLCAGAKLLLVDDTVRTDGAKLADLLRDKEVTAMQATPATWRLLLEAGWTGSAEFTALCGGEALPGDLMSRLLRCTRRLWNMYGPTETTVWSACARIIDPDEPIVIGRPIANTQIYVLDERLEPVPIGVSGEICIGGEGVSLGYLGNAELTNERFIPDPFSTLAGARIYRTGDLGRYRENGDLECLGRNDQQLKLRGFRIELGEIEAVLRRQANILDAAVVAKSFAAGDQRLVAYLVAKNGSSVSVSEMRTALREKLPDYMLPSFFVAIDMLPLTPNGKLDRKRLTELDQGTALDDAVNTEPESETERIMVQLWKDVLKVPYVNPLHTFFEQGGTSLLVLPLAIQIDKTLKVRLSPGVLAGQTLREIAALCAAKQAGITPSNGFLSRLFGKRVRNAQSMGTRAHPVLPTGNSDLEPQKLGSRFSGKRTAPAAGLAKPFFRTRHPGDFG